MIATRAATGHHFAQKAAPKRQAALKVASLGFYYKQDENARYLDLKTQWQTEHKGLLSGQKASEFADTAYQQASVEAPFSQWRAQGGPAPKVFSAKLHLYSNTKAAVLNTPISVSVQANVGDLRVSPITQLTDYRYLQQTAHWETLETRQLSVPVIAPEEDQLLEVMQFRLLSFLNSHPNQWPTAVRITISSPRLGVAEKQISLLPDHFVVPVLY